MTRVYRSPNYDARLGVVAVLVMHYTGMENAEAALTRLCERSSHVSAHYVVDEDGTVFSLVDEDKRAWHAGQGHWRGMVDINTVSVGIEIVNPGHDWGYRAFPQAQLEAVADLARSIIVRHDILSANVIGHSDSAPLRKADPGELFDWAWLAARGVGVWPEGEDPASGLGLRPGGRGLAVGAFQQDLVTYGYGLLADGIYGPETTAVVTAFQRHFRPAKVDGIADEETIGRLMRLLRLEGGRANP